MEDLKKILSQLMTLQKQLHRFTEKDQTGQFPLHKLAEIAELFMDSSPGMEVHTYKDEVVISGEIPNILNPHDVSVTLDSGIILRIQCRYYKSSDAGNLLLEPSEFKKKIELPYPVIPGSLNVTYQNGILRITAKRAGGTSTWVARAQFVE